MLYLHPDCPCIQSRKMSYRPQRNQAHIRSNRIDQFLSPIAPLTAKNVTHPTAIQSLVTVKAAPRYSRTLSRTSKTLRAGDNENAWPVGPKGNGDNDAMQYTPAIIVDDDARDPGPNGMPQHVRFCTNGLHISQIWDADLGTRAHFLGMVIASRSEDEVYGTRDGTTSAKNYGNTGVHGMLPLQVHGTLDFINFGVTDIEMNDTVMWAPQPINNGTPPVGDGRSETAYRIGLLPLPANLHALLSHGGDFFKQRQKQDPVFKYIVEKMGSNKKEAVEAYVRHAHACRVGKCYRRAAPGEQGLVFVVPH